LRNSKGQRICGAWSRRNQGPCMNHTVMENNRCRMHGGKSVLRTPGSMYSKYLSDEEKGLYSNVKLGELDDEIRLAKVQLARAVRLKEEEPNAMVTGKKVITTRDSGAEEVSVETRPRDYDGIIETRLARVERLERTRKDLLASMDKDMTLTIVGGLPRKD